MTLISNPDLPRPGVKQSEIWVGDYNDPPLKQNEHVLSSQALNVGRSLGVSSSKAKFTFRFRCSGMPRSSIKMLGKLAIGEILHAGQERQI